MNSLPPKTIGRPSSIAENNWVRCPASLLTLPSVKICHLMVAIVSLRLPMWLRTTEMCVTSENHHWLGSIRQKPRSSSSKEKITQPLAYEAPTNGICVTLCWGWITGDLLGLFGASVCAEGTKSRGFVSAFCWWFFFLYRPRVSVFFSDCGVYERHRNKVMSNDIHNSKWVGRFAAKSPSFEGIPLRRIVSVGLLLQSTIQARHEKDQWLWILCDSDCFRPRLFANSVKPYLLIPDPAPCSFYQFLANLLRYS